MSLFCVCFRILPTHPHPYMVAQCVQVGALDVCRASSNRENCITVMWRKNFTHNASNVNYRD